MTASRATKAPIDILVEPNDANAGARASAFHDSIAGKRDIAETRKALGLAIDRPIVMTGHQVAWWHAGILAKYIACESIAHCIGGEAVWVTPDQDESDYPELAAPVRDKAGTIQREVLALTDVTSATRLPAASAPVIRNAEVSTDSSPALASVKSGLDRLNRTLRTHESESTAAKQVSAALTDLMAPHVSPAPVVFASELHKTDLFNRVVDRLREDASEATRLYNEAAAAVPQARVAPLMRVTASGRFELPLWRLEPSKPRRTVFAHEVNAIPREQLAPKALLFTGFLRFAACDLFIHGTGGGVYDQVTERWFKNWLGEDLAPVLVVSATLRLPLGSDGPTPHDINRAVWKAHHALHHPRFISQDELQEERDSIARRIDALKSHGEDPSPAFRALQEFLTQYRTAHRESLDSLRHEANAMLALRQQSEVAADRTWPFFFHDGAALSELAERIDASVCPSTATVN